MQQPLLTKELTELASRRRTYIIRVLYAFLLFGFSLAYLYGVFQDTQGDVLRVLGRGHELFTAIVTFQLAGIAIFLPAMMSGAIAIEKERDTLSLLLLTDLRPRKSSCRSSSVG